MHIQTDNVKFSTHIATVVTNQDGCVAFFNCMRRNGYPMVMWTATALCPGSRSRPVS